MKFSPSANVALASIALSSPNLLSSPVFAKAAPTRDNGVLSPNLGSGYFGTSPQMHVTESPVMPTMSSPPTSKIVGRRRSLRRSRSIKHRKDEGASCNIDPLGLGMSASHIQSEAGPILHPRTAPTVPFSGTQDNIYPFSPIVGSGGLLPNTGLVPPNTPILGGVPLSDGVDPSMLLGTIPAIVPTPGVDSVIPMIQSSVTSGTPSAIFSPLTTGSLPYVNGLSPSLEASPAALPQFPPGLTPELGNLCQLPGGLSPLAEGLSSVQGIAPQVSGAPSKVSNIIPHVPGAQTGSPPIAIPNTNGLAPPIIPNLGVSPNVAMPPIADVLPQAPGPVAGATDLVRGLPQVSDAVSNAPGAIPQGIVPQVPGGTGTVPQVTGVIPQLPADPLSKVNPSLSILSLTGAAPAPVAPEIPLASPVISATGSAAPTSSLAVPPASVVPLSSIALPTSASDLKALPTPISHPNALPTLTKAYPLAQPIESLASPDPLPASDSVPHILVSSPDELGVFEPLEGIRAGAMGRPEDDGAQTEGARPEKGDGIRPMMGRKFGSGMSAKGRGTQITSGIESVVESGTTSWSATQSQRPIVDRTTSELNPTNFARLTAKLDVPTTTELFASMPTEAVTHITASPEPTLDVNKETLSARKRRESNSPGLPNDIGSSAMDESGSPLLSEGFTVPTSSVYLPSTTRLSGPSQDSLSVSRSASMVTLKSFSMASVTESVPPILTPAQTDSPAIGHIGSPLDMPQPIISDDSLSSHSSSDESPLDIFPTAAAVARSPVITLYTGGVPLSRTFERSADTPSSVVAISEDSPNMPSPTSLGSGTSMGSQDMTTRKVFRWGVPKMVTSTIRSVATAVKR
ncbi:hypothetical protein OPQ81_002790 [Rhizoctonia solani]|nr:hypothetical protein OPQ81_002790 [Rhizoctonia solani]